MSDTIDLIAALQAEWLRAGRRSWKLLELAMHPPKAALGATPKAETDRRRKARLFRYHGEPRHPVPVLAIAQIRRHAGASRVSMLAHCMGVTLGVCHPALHPAAPVHRSVSLAGPIDSPQGGLFAQRLAFGHFDGDRVADTFGTIPPEFFQVAFGWFGGTAGGPGPSSGDGG
jgi:hypothetical protein